MRRTIIVSDLTGAEFESDVDGDAIKITVNGRSGTRDLKLDEIEALTAFAESGDASKLRAILAPAPAPAASKPARKSGKSGSGNKSASPRNAHIREWARESGKTVPERGRMPEALVSEYDATKPEGYIPAAA